MNPVKHCIGRPLYLKSKERVWGLDDNYRSDFSLILFGLNSNANLSVSRNISVNNKCCLLIYCNHLL